MAAVSTLVAAAGVAVAGYGMYESYQGAQDNNAAQQAAIAAQQEAERLRKQQMDLDANRRRREILRQSTAARSASLAQTTAQGAANEGGSSLPGAFGSLSGRLGVNLLGVNQNQEIGTGIFSAHQAQLTAYSQAADAQSRMAFGQGLTSLGGALINNAGPIGRVGSFIGGSVSNAASFANWDGPTGFLSNPRGR